jgi:hypothetical protein
MRDWGLRADVADVAAESRAGVRVRNLAALQRPATKLHHSRPRRIATMQDDKQAPAGADSAAVNEGAQAKE